MVKTSYSLFGSFRVDKLLRDLGVRDLRPPERVADEHGLEFLRNAYRYNLNEVMKEVKKICERAPGEKVITSDHGELLGENGVFGHILKSDNKLLRNVPWLEVGK